MSVTISRQGALFSLEGNVPLELTKFIHSEFSYKVRNLNVFTNTIEFLPCSLFTLRKDGAYILPIGCLRRVQDFCDKRLIPYKITGNVYGPLPCSWDILKANVNFRPGQEKCLAAIDEVLQKAYGGVIVAPPAFGKSFLISAICLLYSGNTIDIITRRRDVALTLYNYLQRYHPKVGIVTTGYKQQERITVYTAKSLGHSSLKADIICLDEVHELVTDSIFPAIMHYPTPRRLGFTATVDTRFDNHHKRIEALCGPIIFEVDYSFAQSAGLVVPIIVQWLDYDSSYDPTDGVAQLSLRKRLGIWQNYPRNKKIAAVATEFYNQGLQTLILTETIEHALTLQQLLPQFEVCYAGTNQEGGYPNDIQFVKISPKRREELRQKFMARQLMGVIATGVWSAGVSFDGLEVLIRADGMASKTQSVQAPGRVSRISSDTGKSYGIVVDFVDDFNYTFKAHTKARVEMYAKNNWLQFSPHGKVIKNANQLFAECRQ